jgi:HD-GYP domain-containing protein (c-di-GMP phosphodiesterase class II)
VQQLHVIPATQDAICRSSYADSVTVCDGDGVTERVELVPEGRLAELTIALSLATDLGTGQPMEHGLRATWLSLQVAEGLGLDAAARSCVYYVALLRFVGCTSDASETAAMSGGDELSFNAAMAPILMASGGEATRHFVAHLAENTPWPRRAGLVARALADPKGAARSAQGHCEVAERLAGRLGLNAEIRLALAHGFERFDGKGHPDGWEADAVPIAVRIVGAARDAELFGRAAGWAAARDTLVGRSGKGYDPAVVNVLVAEGEAWLAESGDDLCARVLDAEPAPVIAIAPDDLDGTLGAIAEFVDLKSPWLRTHSTGVSELAADASRAAGLSDDDATKVRRAALVHDVGRVGVPSGIWDRDGPLTTEQWERVRLHPYLTERVLTRCSMLRALVDVAGRHHERADGSGYHRGAKDTELDLSARMLAAADAYHAMTEARPYRPALVANDAAKELRADVHNSRFDQAEVDAVLEAAGQASSRSRADFPAGLTEREVEVLRLIARGQANKQVATQLGISRKTVGHHIEHIYAKAGVTTRAGATLFAMENRLLT